MLNIKELREKAGLTQKEFGDLIGVKPLTVIRYEQSPEKIPTTAIKLIEYEFGIRQPPADNQLSGVGQATAIRSSTPGKGIPLVRPEAIAGPGNFELSVFTEEALDFYQIPDLKDADFLMRVRGDSMSSTYNPGDIVACRKVNERINLAWNRIYVISTRNWGMLIKRIKPGKDGLYELISDNPEYDPMNMTGEDIHELALVIGGVRLEG